MPGERLRWLYTLLPREIYLCVSVNQAAVETQSPINQELYLPVPGIPLRSATDVLTDLCAQYYGLIDRYGRSPETCSAMIDYCLDRLLALQAYSPGDTQPASVELLIELRLLKEGILLKGPPNGVVF